MALGKPVIANICEGVGTAELVEDGASGFLIEPKNEILMAEKINVLLNDTGLRDRMGEYGRTVVSNKFSIDQMVERFLGLYKEVLNK